MATDYKKIAENITKKLYFGTVEYENDVDMMDKIVQIYSITKTKSKKERILPFEKEILVYYLLYGFNSEAKEVIKDAKNKTENQINVTNNKLRNKGYLIKNTKNHTKGHVVKELRELADAFLKDSEMLYTLKFKK